MYLLIKLDYCNSLFINLPSSSLNHLQCIQNFAARLLLRQSRYSHATPLLKHLHWLPVQDRVVFKLMLLTYKSINLKTPHYLKSLINLKSPSRPTRHIDDLQLDVIRSHSVRMGDCSYSIAAPPIWNSLPYHIRNAP